MPDFDPAGEHLGEDPSNLALGVFFAMHHRSMRSVFWRCDDWEQAYGVEGTRIDEGTVNVKVLRIGRAGL